MNTIWRTVQEATSYSVSNLGEVRRFVPDSRGRVGKGALRPSPNQQGYMHVSLVDNGRKWTRTVHTIVAKAFLGEKPDPKFHAAHKDGNQLNNHASNLKWCSPSENESDKIAHGTKLYPFQNCPEKRPRGSQHSMARLSENDVRAIRSDARTQTEIARSYGISQSNVSDIKRGNIWTHILEASDA